jgi:polysaccharide pyruvyl transferase WcaK-like protein
MTPVCRTEEAVHQRVHAVTRSPRKIGLLDHLGGGNLGDDATLAAVLQNIKSRWPDAEICGFSMNPSDTQARHGITSYPIRTQTWSLDNKSENADLNLKSKAKARLRKYRFFYRAIRSINAAVMRAPRALFRELFFLARSSRVIRSFDLLIVSGGGQLLDSWGGPWKFPYTLFKWVMLAKVSGVQCYFLNVGAGPLSHSLSKWFVKRTLSFADYVSFRDHDSKAFIQGMGFTGKSDVVVDCVYSLELSAPARAAVASRESAVVGLSPMAYCDPRVYWRKDQAVYDHFVRTLARFGSWLSENRYRLALFSTDILFDAQTVEDLKSALTGSLEARRIVCVQISGIKELLEHISSMDYVVTCRFHGVVFAHLLNKPVLALSHHPKVSTLMNDLGLAEYCLDIRTCNLTVLTETFTSLVKNSRHIKRRMVEKDAAYQVALSAQFNSLFPREVTR